MCKVYLVMGVSGSGKSTVGRALAQRLGVPFYDGDDFHPAANVAKMSRGIPLDDADRVPWLARLHDLIAGHLARGTTAVIACSALKKQYRDQLRAGNEGVDIIYLQGSYALIRQRMAARPDHFMPAGMLRSQFDALEPPAPHSAFCVDVDQSVDSIVDHILRHITAAGA